ncbi:MAG: Stage V sporulation protein B [Firmicutes bacterium]|nr:Stage V sporulation protein B [Bacillota bacterium]
MIGGTAGMILLAASSRTLAFPFVGEERLWVPLLAMAPALLIVSLGGAVRGYSQGMRYMSLIATGLIAEQAAHVIASIYLAFSLQPLGAGGISLGLAMGYTLGELCGLLTLLALLVLSRRVAPTADARFGPLLSIVIPVAAGRLILSLTSALQAVLIPRSLRHMGYSASAAAIAYGQLTGMAVTVLFVPPVLTFPLASNLLPAMAESGDRIDTRYGQRSFLRGLTIALLLGWPSSVLFIAAGVEICTLLFGVAEAGQLLSSMGWVAWMIYLQHITTATLQGLGKPAVPTRNAAICTIFSSLAIVAGTYARPELGIHMRCLRWSWALAAALPWGY